MDLPRSTFLQFEGLDAQIELIQSDDLVGVIAQAARKWPFVTSDQPTKRTAPFAILTQPSKGQFDLRLNDAPQTPRRWNTVNAVCDLMVEMAWERLRTKPDLLCVHGAAVAFGDQLTLFPNARRAGKSTLACVLAHQGFEIFTDDFLMMGPDDEGVINGLATGIAPRLRRPAPETFSQAFKDWIDADTGPQNKQYKYLTSAPIADFGTPLPLGAIVLLDRQADPPHPRLDPINKTEALESLILQNFARAGHAGDILSTLDAIATGIPAYRLTFDSAEDAAVYLQEHPAMMQQTKSITVPSTPHRQAPLSRSVQRRPSLNKAVRYCQAAGVTTTQAGDANFLVDANGVSIFRLNAGSAAIWNILAEPASLSEVIDILCAAFPEIGKDQIAHDSETTLEQFAAAHLIEHATETS